jgi:sortase A
MKVAFSFVPRLALRYLQVVFLVVGCVATGITVWVYVSAWLFQTYQNWRFTMYRAGQPAPVDGLAAPRVMAPEGSTLGRIEFPRLAMSVMFVEGIQPRTLRLGAGHIPGTALPGDAGNVAIAGHRDTFFRGLRNIRAGDTIVVTTSHESRTYSVEWMRVVRPEEIGVLAPSAEPILTLVTCYPFYYFGHAPQRFIVRARETGVGGS